MSDQKNTSAYGTAAGDTSFRKTWDRETYAAKGAEHERQRKEEARARYEAKLTGKKYVRRASTPPDARDTEARSSRLNVAALVGKTQLVPAGAGTGKRGRSAGFYCEACDLTFKDNLQFVEHLNSKQHLAATGQSGEVKRADAKEVRERLIWLKRKQDDEKKEEVIDLVTRLEVRKELDEKEREEKRRRRNEKRRKTKDGMGIQGQEVVGDGVIC